MGAKKFGMSLATQGNQTFWAGYAGILQGYPGGARKVWEKKFVFNFRPLQNGQANHFGQNDIQTNIVGALKGTELT